MIPAKADPEAQAAYLAQEIEPRLAEAQAGQRAVFSSTRPILCWPRFSAFSGR